MDLETLWREILSDCSETGRERSLNKVYKELEKTKGYKRKVLGKTKYGPVYLCGPTKKARKKDVLLLGGIHPFCEAATAVAVVHAMREKPDCNLYAIPVVSPWAFVAPIDYKEVDAAYTAEQYRCDKYHANAEIGDIFECREGDNFEGDLSRLKDLGRTFDLTVECHMGFDFNGKKLGQQTNNVEMILSDVTPGFVKPLYHLLYDAAECGISPATPLFDREYRLGHLLNECGANLIIETNPNDLTLVQRFLDRFVKRL